jgi:arylsulfatase A-like enzyme
MYNHKAGIGEMTEDRHLPGYRGHITDSVATIAELLKLGGYDTAMSGKWHVSNTVEQLSKEDQMKWLNHQAYHPFFSPVEQYPTNRGFEKYFGNIWGVVDYFDPFVLASQSLSGLLCHVRLLSHLFESGGLPVLKDNAIDGHAMLCNEHYGARYIRYEGWKLVAKNKEPWHLYHITKDATEQYDLAEKYPAKVHELDSMWNDWANNNHVYPK